VLLLDELRKIPRNIEAEQAVIGAMLIDSRCIPEVIEHLSRDDFYEPVHQEIFDTLYTMFAADAAFDPVIVLGEMQKRGVYNEKSSEYINRLLDITPTAAHAGHYAKVVSEQAVLRRLDEAAGEISNAAREPGADSSITLDLAEQSIYGIRKGKISLYPITEVLQDVYRHMQELAEAGGKLPGLPSGISELDNAIGGLINSNFILIASRPGMGKTSFALGIGLNAAKATGKSVAFFSLEMSRDQLVTRLLSASARIDSQKLMRGSLSAGEWEDLGESAGELSQIPYLFDDNPSISVGEMKAKCRRISDLGLIIIDYLQLMQGMPGKRYDNRTGEVGEISRSLKIMAKDLGVPVVCLSQLSRENEKRGDKRPMLSDLRESGAIEQDADVVMFLYRDEYYNPEDTEKPGIAECIIAKNRHGKTGTLELAWAGEYTTFSAVDRVHYEY